VLAQGVQLDNNQSEENSRRFFMRKVFWLGCVASLSLACIPPEETLIIDLAPVDAGLANQVVVDNDTGDITIEGELGRTTVEVQVTLRGGVQEDFDQVLALSTLDGNTITVTLDVPSNLANVVGDVLVLVPDFLTSTLNAEAGAVNAINLTDGVFIGTDGGDVSCQDVTGGINIITNAGDVTINTSMNVGDLIKVKTEIQGDITVTLPGNTDADLIATTGGGNIAISADLGFVGDNLDSVATGVLNAGSGDQTKIDLFTQGGEISLLAQ
jgi:hypothetical protein